MMKETAETHRTLWKKVEAFNIGNPEADFSFRDRLARENNWTADFAERVITEYKRFMFLVMIAERPLTPSDAVDQAWHLHLTYTKSYWKDFCAECLGREIHHNPTEGRHERSKFEVQYADFKTLYAEHFGEAPPQKIWPSGKKRFGEIRFRRVNMHRNLVIPKPAPRLSLALIVAFVSVLGLFSVQASWLSEVYKEMRTETFIIAGVCFFVVILILILRKRGTGGGSSGGSTGCGGCGGCG
jgi:hypothetical protein